MLLSGNKGRDEPGPSPLALGWEAGMLPSRPPPHKMWFSDALSNPRITQVIPRAAQIVRYSTARDLLDA